LQVDVGSIFEGKITGITKYGAFVQLPGGKTGMVHISEVSNEYVKEISDHLSDGDTVKVKVLAITDDGKVSLSIKRCLEPAADAPPPRRDSRPPQDRPRAPRAVGWQPKKQAPTDGLSFEDMMTRFKQSSNDRMSDLKRGVEQRRPRRGGGSSK